MAGGVIRFAVFVAVAVLIVGACLLGIARDRRGNVLTAPRAGSA